MSIFSYRKPYTPALKGPRITEVWGDREIINVFNIFHPQSSKVNGIPFLLGVLLKRHDPRDNDGGDKLYQLIFIYFGVLSNCSLQKATNLIKIFQHNKFKYNHNTQRNKLLCITFNANLPRVCYLRKFLFLQLFPTAKDIPNRSINRGVNHLERCSII